MIFSGSKMLNLCSKRVGALLTDNNELYNAFCNYYSAFLCANDNQLAFAQLANKEHIGERGDLHEDLSPADIDFLRSNGIKF